MKDEEYLQQILESQRFGNDDKEVKALRAERDKVEKFLRDAYGSGPTIRYGGSHAKGTMIKASYDLDVLCYFAFDDESAGKTLKEIHASVLGTLKKDYFVEVKRSALRLRSKDKSLDFQIDVVPGRFVDDTKTDVSLFQADGSKDWFKTNPDKHIGHVKGSGHVDVICMMKYWVHRYVIDVKTFVLELAIIEALKGCRAESLEGRLMHLLVDFREDIDTLKVEDPANPTGNDLSALWSDVTRATLKSVAKQTLETVERDGWEPIFGPLPMSDEARSAAVRTAARRVTEPTRPWRT